MSYPEIINSTISKIRYYEDGSIVVESKNEKLNEYLEANNFKKYNHVYTIFDDIEHIIFIELNKNIQSIQEVILQNSKWTLNGGVINNGKIQRFRCKLF